ncbi:hypothetical protein R8Z50_30510 [Longispora sp. K20-0274]|uniref:hypothetical protein n=1 Tax=Longispora sp. K20-0274 TaxID=3088255 RepID=UPI00399AC473
MHTDPSEDPRAATIRATAYELARHLLNPQLRKAVRAAARGKRVRLVVAGAEEAIGDVIGRIRPGTGQHILAIEDPAEPLGYRLVRVGG